MKGKRNKTLKLNGLNVEVNKSQSTVRIKDKMSNCTEGEAAKICSYLFREGFLKEGTEVICEIIQS